MKVGIIGFGDMGQQLYHFLREDRMYSEAEFYIFDDLYISNGLELSNSSFFDFKKDEFADLVYFVGLGYKRLKEKKDILLWLEDNDRLIGTYIHPTSIINHSSSIEDGVIIYPGCIVDQRVVVQKGSILNNGVIISHDSVIESCCFLSPGVIVCGFCEIQETSFIGAGTAISDNIRIGKNCFIGINSSVTRNLADHTFAIGNPLQEKNFSLF